jgi:selenium metabolism protein YedF
MKTVDCRGMACPKPLILAKKALNELGKGDRMVVLIDNETSKQNVERFLRDNGVAVSVEQDGGLFSLTVDNIGSPSASVDELTYCTEDDRNKPHVICFKSDAMGTGPAELGTILMKAFINSIKEVKPLPSHCVFYNTGVTLVAEGSPLVEPLRELSDMGVKIFVCGTCLDYFGIKDKIKVGTVSNMYTILETLTAAGHIIEP